MQRFLTKLKGKINTWILGNKNLRLKSHWILQNSLSFWTFSFVICFFLLQIYSAAASRRPLFSSCCLKQQPSALLCPTPSQPLTCFSDSHAFRWLFRGLPSSGPGRENLTGSAGGLIRGVCPGLVSHGQQKPAVT